MSIKLLLEQFSYKDLSPRTKLTYSVVEYNCSVCNVQYTDMVSYQYEN